MSEKNEDLEVITGNGSELELSPVYGHLNALKPKTKEEEKKKKIVIPEVKKKKE